MWLRGPKFYFIFVLASVGQWILCLRVYGTKRREGPGPLTVSLELGAKGGGSESSSFMAGLIPQSPSSESLPCFGKLSQWEGTTVTAL